MSITAWSPSCKGSPRFVTGRCNFAAELTGFNLQTLTPPHEALSLQCTQILCRFIQNKGNLAGALMITSGAVAVVTGNVFQENSTPNVRPSI